MPLDRAWWRGPIRLLYAGFDGLDVAFQGCLSDQVLALFADARAEAEVLNGPVARELSGLRFTVAPSGARNGFRYRLDTGDDGEVWLIKHSADTSQWNLFASVKSFALLTHHYAGVKQRLLEHRLAQLEATVLDARPNRIDFACDLDAPGFEPEPDCFVMPPWMRSRSYHPGDGIREGERVEVHRLARRVNGITIGGMPRLQLGLYDKRTDSLLKHKLFWPEVWCLDLAEHRDPVWRVEARAARVELRDRQRVRSFADLEARLGEIVGSALAKVRYIKVLANIGEAIDPEGLLKIMVGIVAAALKKKFGAPLRGVLVIVMAIAKALLQVLKAVPKALVLTERQVIETASSIATVLNRMEPNVPVSHEEIFQISKELRDFNVQEELRKLKNAAQKLSGIAK